MRKKTNSYEILPSGIALIDLTQGMKCLIDASNLHKILPYGWYAMRSRTMWYARTNLPHRKGLLMHNLLLPGSQVDHKNEDGLDNRMCNLRHATASQNSSNSSLHKGVSFYTQTRRWCACIVYEGKRHRAFFATETEALEWRHQKEQELLGEFAPNRTLQ
jgi:hypothetical protein